MLKRRLANISPQGKSTIYLTLMQALFWFAWAFGTYQTVYLQSLGFTSSDIGTLNAIAACVAIFSMTFWGMISDKMNSIKKTLLIVVISTVILFSLVPFIPTDAKYTTLMFFIYLPFVNMFRSANGFLIDNLTVRNCSMNGLNYGKIRSTGSISFTIGSFIIVALLPYVGVQSTFWLNGLIAIPAVIIMFLVDDPKIQKKTKTKVNPKELFKSYYYVTFLVFAFLAYIGFNCEFAFVSFLMEEQGVSTDHLGTLLAVRALFEFPLLFTTAKLRAKFKLKYLLIIATCCMSLECFFFGLFATNLTTFLIGASLFGLGNGLFIGTVSNYIFKLAPDHLKASAQTVFASASYVAGITGNLLGGHIYEAIGGSNFYILLGCIFVSASLVFAVTTFIRKGLPNPADELG